MFSFFVQSAMQYIEEFLDESTYRQRDVSDFISLN